MIAEIETEEKKTPDWLNLYLEYTARSEPPRLYHVWTAISTIAAVLQRKCLLNWGTLTYYPNMYIVLVGPSGCRKGTALNFSLSMLDEIGVTLASEAITREALIRELKNSSVTHTDQNTGRMFPHSSLTIFSPELTVFLGYMNKQLMSDMTDWYDCRTRWTYRTKNQGTDEILGVWVNLIGGTTPDLVRETLPQEAIGGGLTSRIIFVYAKRKDHKEVIPYGDPETRLKLVQELELIRMMSGEFKVTEDFISAYSDWYLKHSDEPLKDPRFSGYVDRRANHIFKLCMILSAARSREMVITGSDFSRATKILYEVEPHMVEVFQGMGRNPLSDVTNRISRAVREIGPLSFSEITDQFCHDATSVELEEVMGTLIRIGHIERVVKEGITIYQKKER